MEELFSCRNCVHNSGQSLNAGPGKGYCQFHSSVIDTPEQTTCKYLLVFCKVVAAGVKIGKTGDCSKDTGLSHHAALALCRVLVVWARPWACCSRSRSSANRPSIARCVRTRYTVFCILR